MGNLQSLEQVNGTLSRTEIERLEKRMRRLGRGRAEIARSDLHGLDGNIGQNPFIERLFQLYDSDRDGLLLLSDMTALMQVLSQLRDEEARYKFAFEVFDFNGDGFIDRDELLTILQLTNRRGMTLNQLEQIADSTMERWDVQRRGKLIYPEFKALLGASTAVLSL